METKFTNLEYSRTFEYHVLILKLTDKLDLKRGEKTIAYDILVSTIHGKTQKAQTITINSKYQL